MREFNFDGLVGPTHGYGGLSAGNLASTEHAGESGNPRAAALQGLEKMRFVAGLGVPQAVLPPQPRPDLAALRRLGFGGDDALLLAAAAREGGALLKRASSASAMWTANAATVTPSSDSEDGKLHLTVANLCSMFHRSLEANTTLRVLRSIFASGTHFAVHEPLPDGGAFSDEGAANHIRLFTGRGVRHVFGYGRSAFTALPAPSRYPARQTLEASRAVARLNRVRAGTALFWQQSPAGIDAGAFHSDVLAVGNAGFLMLHERAFVDTQALLDTLRGELGPELAVCLARSTELPVDTAVRTYPFNSQLLSLPSGKMAIVAPLESQANASARSFLERIVAEANPVSAVHYIDVNESMKNGGGPACLRLRVALNEAEEHALGARVVFDDALYADLKAWIERHYRDRLTAEDLLDPSLVREVHTALDELSVLLRLGSVYEFQLG